MWFLSSCTNLPKFWATSHRHSEEVAGGKHFALVKPNADGAPIPNAWGASVDADVRGVVIGSTWRRFSASLAVDESSLAVADYLLG